MSEMRYGNNFYSSKLNKIFDLKKKKNNLIIFFPESFYRRRRRMLPVQVQLEEMRNRDGDRFSSGNALTKLELFIDNHLF